jgi:DNA-binding NtrC family response regulator
MTRILIIDDDKTVPRFLQEALRDAGNEVEIATDADVGLARAQQEDYDVVITDLHWDIPDTKRLEPKGLRLIEQLHQAMPRLPIILMTAKPDTETTIEATRRGAMDYLAKPCTEEEMEKLVNTVREAARSARKEPRSLTAAPGSPSPAALVGKSRVMQDVYKEIGRVAAKPATVLIRGETGTGKELVARALHEHSGRNKEKFVVVNCPAIPASLLESELFGHEAGAFTDAKARRIGRFEQADRGTIFLDEIGDMDVNLQQKFLRVLQEKTIQRIGGQESFSIDVRVVAATHRDLEAAIQEKNFREDLYYRLNDAVIRLPPLRERLEDVPDLVRHFLQQFRGEVGATKPTITEDAIKLLQRHTWPGNVRELKNVVHKALLLARGFTITRELVQKARDQISHSGSMADTALFARTQSFPDRPLAAFISELLDKAERGETENVQTIVLEEVERELYGAALRMAEGDQTKAAGLLGVSRPTMREKLTRYRLLPARPRPVETAAV